MGDGGELDGKGKHPVTEAIKNTIKPDNNTIILMLGDNVYKRGVPPRENDTAAYNTAVDILYKQLNLVNDNDAKLYVIPGNHDWNHSKPGGWEAIKKQQELTDNYKKGFTEFYPKQGCPGPQTIPVGNDIVLVLFDSEWWLRKYEKGKDSCECGTEDELVKEFEEIGKANPDKLLIIASHHPFYSKGPHGGYFTIKQHLFPFTDIRKWAWIPLPVLGSLYPILRGSAGVSRQDLSNKHYKRMITRVRDAVSTNNKTLFVAGHEHGLQLKLDGNKNYIVSGGASKTTRVNKRKLDFGSAHPGFCVLEVSSTHAVTIKFYAVTDSTAREQFKTELFK